MLRLKKLKLYFQAVNFFVYLYIKYTVQQIYSIQDTKEKI
jgi:hypothetical protein